MVHVGGQTMNTVWIYMVFAALPDQKKSLQKMYAIV